ncbi:MAG TPA: type II secretion system F family protein [Methylomirabilota bacterium]|nr:type II secretion system F family protein [Methylomirabilota bacterium]
MAIFVYRAADREGQTIDGVMDAPDVRAVVERLQRDAYFPIEVSAQTPGAGLLGLPRSLLGGRISGRDLLAFTQQLANLLEAGVPLDRALAMLEELTPNRRLRAIAGDVLRSVRGGSSLTEALSRHHPRPFSRLYINMVRAGERGGVLEQTLRRLAGFLEEAQELREAVVSALIYPCLLTAVGGAAVVFLLTFVIPRFADIFRDLGQAMPLPTRVLLAVSGAVQEHWWLLAVAVIAGVAACRLALATPWARWHWDRLVLRLPLVGPLVLGTETARFARVLGTLLKSGVPVLTALEVVADLSSNQVVVQGITRVADGVRRGVGMAALMAGSEAFPPLAVYLVRVGEETGRLEDLLLKIAADFESAVRRLVKRLIALLEPGIILIVGLLIGFIVVALLMAIFSLTEVSL